MSGTFDALFAGGDEPIARAYLLPLDDALENEPVLTAEQREAVRALRNEALRQSRERLERVAELWRMLHRHAKKTVHGLGFLAGTMVIEAPGAGRIGELRSGETGTNPRKTAAGGLLERQRLKIRQ